MEGNRPQKKAAIFRIFRMFRVHSLGFSGQFGGDPTKARSHLKTGIFMKGNRPQKTRLHFPNVIALSRRKEFKMHRNSLGGAYMEPKNAQKWSGRVMNNAQNVLK